MVCGLLRECHTGAGVNHAQFGDDKRNAPRGDIVATVSYEQARAMIAEVRQCLVLAQHLGGAMSATSDGIPAPFCRTDLRARLHRIVWLQWELSF